MNRLEKQIYKDVLQEKLRIYSAIMFQSGTFFPHKHKSTAHQSLSILFQQTRENPAGKSRIFNSCYFCLAIANYMMLMTLGSYLRNHTAVVVKPSMLCTAVISCTIF